MIKNAIYFLILFTSLMSCTSKERAIIKNTEKEGYELINILLFKDISENGEQIVFYEKQLNETSYPINETDKSYFDKKSNPKIIEDALDTIKISPINDSKYSNKKWNQKELVRIKILKDSTFKRDRKYDSIKLFSSKMKIEFNNTILFEVSYPVFSDNGKVAVISVEKIDTEEINNCIPHEYMYVYVKENNNWKSLKKYGTDNIYITLERYYREKELNKNEK